uniref:Putative secreted protein n=1 Tax=Ixodes ricinus TaxID=34613 RepID=A0A6B0UP18_IXORI
MFLSPLTNWPPFLWFFVCRLLLARFCRLCGPRAGERQLRAPPRFGGCGALFFPFGRSTAGSGRVGCWRITTSQVCSEVVHPPSLAHCGRDGAAPPGRRVWDFPSWSPLVVLRSLVFLMLPPP